MFFSRGKNKVQDPYTFKDFYKFYENETEGNQVYAIEFKEYVEILTKYYKTMMDDVLLKAGTIYLPFGMGSVCVVKKKAVLEHLSGQQVDWKTTNETGVRVFHLNEHSKGYKYIFEWAKRKVKVNKSNLYRFQLTRENKRRLAKLVKSGEYDYYEQK